MTNTSVARAGRTSVPAKFKPEAALAKDVLADAAIEYSVRARDLAGIERAIDEKIENLCDLVAWWDASVQRAGGDKKSKNHSRRSALMVCAVAEELTKFKHQQLSKYRRWSKRRMEWRAIAVGAACKKTLAEDQNYRAEGTGENEWYTPAKYVDAARLVMGSIDLDPASCAEAQAIIKADAFFTRKNDGLKREWHGNVWINPPFSRDLIAPFTGKLAAEYAAGRTKQAILLTHNNTDTEWFHALAYVSSAICFTRGRIPFYRGDWVASPPNGQVFFYLGPDPVRFVCVFSDIGLVVVPRAA